MVKRFKLQVYEILSMARISSWTELDFSIEKIIRFKNDGNVPYKWEDKNKLLVEQILEIVALESEVDVAEKISGLVVKYNVSPNICGRYDMIPNSRNILSRAVYKKRTDAAIALISAGADVDTETPPWGTNTFVFAAENNLIDVVKTMHARFKVNRDLWQTNAVGESALVVSVRMGHAELVKFFLSKGHDPDWYTYDDRKYLLHTAVDNPSSTSTSIVKMLLDAGANPHLRCYTPGNYLQDAPGEGFTPLEFITAKEKGVTRYKDFSESERLTSIANATLLSNKMDDDVTNLQLAVCMAAHHRLGSNRHCLLNRVSGESSIFKMVLDNVGKFNDPSFPGTPMKPGGIESL
jgi:ankyrin repeat protein